MLLESKYRAMKRKRDQAIYVLYHELRTQPGAMAMACEEVVMERFGIYSRGTVWKICQRVQKKAGGAACGGCAVAGLNG